MRRSGGGGLPLACGYARCGSALRLQPPPIRNGRDPPAHPLSGAPRPSLCSRMRDTFAPDPKMDAASTVWTISAPDEICRLYSQLPHWRESMTESSQHEPVWPSAILQRGVLAGFSRMARQAFAEGLETTEISRGAIPKDRSRGERRQASGCACRPWWSPAVRAP